MHFPVSACIITLNEEDNIARCLGSLDFVDEIILVDSGSTDRTLEIARSYNAKIYHRDFDNYINQKNYATSLAKHHWVLSLDADEEISPSLKTELQSLRPTDLSEVAGFAIPRLTYYLKQWIHHCGWYPNRQTRLFDRNRGKFSGMLVHETVHLEGKEMELQSPIHHYSYKTISDHLSFIDRYSTLFAMERFRKGKRSGVCKAIAKSFYKFWWMYIFRLGFLDGKVGLVVCILGSYYNFLKYTKLFELQRDRELVSSLLVMVDTVHNVETQVPTQKDGNQIHVG